MNLDIIANTQPSDFPRERVDNICRLYWIARKNSDSMTLRVLAAELLYT